MECFVSDKGIHWEEISERARRGGDRADREAAGGRQCWGAEVHVPVAASSVVHKHRRRVSVVCVMWLLSAEVQKFTSLSLPHLLFTYDNQNSEWVQGQIFRTV